MSKNKIKNSNKEMKSEPSIDLIAIEGFKTLTPVYIKPKPLNVVWGMNDVGKTNLCLALSLLSDVLSKKSTNQLSSLRIGAGNDRLKYGPWESIISRFSDSSLIKVEYIFKIYQSKIQYVLAIQGATGEIEHEHLSVENVTFFSRQRLKIIDYDKNRIEPMSPPNPAFPFLELVQPPRNRPEGSVDSWWGALKKFKEYASNASYIDLHYNDMLKGARGAYQAAEIDFQACGSDISFLVGKLFDGGTKNVVSFQEEIEKLFGVRVSVHSEGEMRMLKVSDPSQPQKRIPPTELAHGTLKAIYLSCLRHLDLKRRIFIFDELENGMNPELYDWAIATLLKIAENGNFVFFTTHSPLFFNLPSFFDAMKSSRAEVLMTKRSPIGCTQLEAMSSLINNKFGDDPDKFWEEVSVPLGELLMTDYFNF